MAARLRPQSPPGLRVARSQGQMEIQSGGARGLASYIKRRRDQMWVKFKRNQSHWSSVWLLGV